MWLIVSVPFNNIKSFSIASPAALLLYQLADSVLLEKVNPGRKERELQLSHVKPLDTVHSVHVCVHAHPVHMA